MIRGSLLFLLLAVAGACSDGTGPIPPPPGTAPTVDTTVGFGDPPVSGTVTIRRQEPSEAWSFSVDLDSDGDAEASGEVGNGADVPFVFTTPGIHRIRVELSLEGERFQTERLVIVNDLAASEVLRTVAIPADGEPELGLEGITLGEGAAGLELYVAMAFAKRVFRLDPITLEVQSEISLAAQAGNTLEGMDLDPTGEFLYVVSKHHQLFSLATPDLTVDRVVGISGATFTVHALSPRIVLTGGGGPVSQVDTRDGTILNARSILGAVNFAVSADGAALALIQRSDNGQRFIRLLQVPSFVDLETVELPAGFEPVVTAFKPSGDKVYVLGKEAGASGLVRFLVIEVTTGEIAKDQPLEECGICLSSTIANPYAVSFDGRFVIFPSDLGAYVVDSALDLPTLRIGGFEGCCNAAASPTAYEFYFAQTSGEVSIVRLSP